jgi:hypothetical protein
MARLGMRFINSPGLVSAGIDWVTDSLWDHAEFWFDAEMMAAALAILIKHGMSIKGLFPEGGYLGAHAGAGIQFRALNYCVPSRERRYALTCTDEQFEKFVVSAFGKIGVLYNYLGIVGILVRKRKLSSDSREFCSEYCFDEMFRIGIEMLNARDQYRNLITPEILHLSKDLIGHCTYPV